MFKAQEIKRLIFLSKLFIDNLILLMEKQLSEGFVPCVVKEYLGVKYYDF